MLRSGRSVVSSGGVSETVRFLHGSGLQLRSHHFGFADFEIMPVMRSV